jgi:aryl-alcohol dehydrogenase-like predicted oxidoreductase
MEYTRLGDTELQVSRLCLGTMTFGEQNTAAEAHQQLDLAVDRGINFIDTAELYPVPPRAETQGRTEAYIGSWLTRGGARERLVIATKVAGPADWMGHLRGGPRLNRSHIRLALDDSLRRLRTDYVDLYQVHWPERNTNYFGKLGYEPAAEPDAVPIEETLEALAGLVEQGKVRHIGISNETPWGALRYLSLARERGWPRIVSIQNPYSLLNRTFEIGLAEIAQRERLGLLAYSPLGFGVLSGKYLGGNRPPGARLTLFERFSRYGNPQGVRATERYVALAREHGLGPAQMALAFVNSRPFLTATIIGATTPAQLLEDMASLELGLSEEVLAAIEAIHQESPNPCP